ncbi:MAG: methionyl-tRNA formyltransferase [Lentisphaeraceae bacterium]|nr:methionyl-tRNA formyltransferase [Lentisphaeraceae bacterium]
MAIDKIRVFFLGSASIAVPALEALLATDHVELLGVGTQPDRKAGRGNRLTPTPVGKRAEELELAPHKIGNVNDEAFLDTLRKLQIDFLLVIAFGQLLKEPLLKLPKFSCVNVHASILPQYRGASPIASVLLAGEKETGVSIMKMAKGLDTGPVYEIHTLPIEDEDNASTLQDRLAVLAAENIESSLTKIYEKRLLPVEQDHDSSTHCGKILKEDGRIQWQADATTVWNAYRGYSPWPGAFFFIDSPKGARRITITSAQTVDFPHAEKPGTVLDAGKKHWIMACGNNSALEILQVKPEGKKIMAGADFLRGIQVKPGALFT